MNLNIYVIMNHHGHNIRNGNCVGADKPQHMHITHCIVVNPKHTKNSNHQKNIFRNDENRFRIC